MTRPRWKKVGRLAVLCLAGAFALLNVWYFFWGWGVGRSDYHRITPGMTRADLRTILGNPSYDDPKCSSGEILVSSPPLESWGKSIFSNSEQWLGRDHVLAAYFDGEDKVVGARLSKIRFDSHMLFARKARHYLGLK